MAGTPRHIRTGAAVAALAVLAACGGGSKAAQHTGSGAAHSATTTRAPRPYRWPLTGVATSDPAATARPALTVKIDNNSAAHPQSGLEAADVVYEEVVECDYTRLAAVFQSRVPAVVGPIRSVRKTDTLLVHPLRGIFAYSGGAPYAITSIQTAPVVRLDETTAGVAMFRDGSGGRVAPHNLFGHGPLLYAHAGGAHGPPSALFEYGPIGAAPSTRATHVDVGFKQGYAITWDYDAATKLWKRGIFGRPDVVAGNGPQLAVRNVVVMSVDYTVGQGACHSVGAQAELQGHGALAVFRDGRALHGTWQYDSTDGTQHLFDAAGAPLRLDAGSTWVELPKPTYAVTDSVAVR